MQTTSPLRRLARNEYTWVGIAFVIAIVVAYLILRSTTTGTFDNLEQQNIQSQANRISTSLNYERSAMSNFVLTNAAWDDPYNAIQQDQRNAMSDMFTASQTRDSFNLGALILLDNSGQLVTGGTIPAKGSSFDTPDATLISALSKSAVHPAGTKAGATACGILDAGFYYLYCSSPVVHTRGDGPSDGWLVAMQPFNATGAAAFGKRAGIDAALGAAGSGGTT